jgi:hypothetical protein
MPSPTHGHAGRGKRSPTYNSWRAMIERCTRESHPFYPLYGGRGIKVIPGWRGYGGFDRFLTCMGERPHNMTLDRIDPDDDYRPGNCQWATPQQQRWNRRDMAVMADQMYLPTLIDGRGEISHDLPF